MSPAWIRKREQPPTDRKPKGSRSYQVLYRRGGRHFKIETAGTFPSERLAKLRRDLVAGWLAQGMDPKVELAKLTATPTRPVSFRQTVERMILTRHDAAGETIKGIRVALEKVAEVAPELADRPAADWTVADAQELVALMVEDGLAPSTVLSYMTDIRVALDFAEVTPNPARDRRVKLPAQTRAEVSPPSKREVLAILGLLNQWHRLPFCVLEQTAMRVGEIASLPWGDVDVAGCRFRLARERTKTRHPRWVQLPDWLMGLVADTCPAEDRTAGRLVFPRVGGVTGSALRTGMARACKTAGIPLYSPHDLRHRRASLWHGQGVTARELMARGGWTKSEIAIDTYSHVMPLEEVERESWERLLVRSP